MFDWIVDNLYGPDDIPTGDSWIARHYNPDEAPIMRLCEAILLQAASDEASGIRLSLGPD